MNRHLSTRVMPEVKNAFELRIAPKAKDGFKDRHAVRKALLDDPYFQTWSALRRMTMEQRQQAGRWIAIRQAEALAAKAETFNADSDQLELHPETKLPRYVSAVDHHCMPGSYHTELFAGDVSGAANYDCGLYVTVGGLLGRYSDGGGKGLVKWMGEQMPDFRPRRVVDIGATVGHNAVPIAQAYPEALVFALDVGAPVLRYGAARAKALGVGNIRFVQADGSDLSMFEDDSVDWVQTTMFLHELSFTSMQQIFAEAFRVLKPGGIFLNLEQPQYTPAMPLFEQAMRDWDAFYNNEPFWSTMHELDVDGYLVKAGFGRDRLIHGGVPAAIDLDLLPEKTRAQAEDFGRKPAWHVLGARK